MLDKEWICLIFFLFFVFGIILGKFKYYWYIDMIVLLFYYEWILSVMYGDMYEEIIKMLYWYL